MKFLSLISDELAAEVTMITDQNDKANMTPRKESQTLTYFPVKIWLNWAINGM